MDKAYIVANEQQEREVLEKLEREGIRWYSGTVPTKINQLIDGSITLFVRGNQLTYNKEVGDEYIDGCKVVYDGRKEEHMSEKYVVSQEFMDELNGWKKQAELNQVFFVTSDIGSYSDKIYSWWLGEGTHKEQNNRLIAIIRWVNGEDVFEVEKPKKWVVRSKGTDTCNDHVHIAIINMFGVKTVKTFYDIDNATKFDTKEEAESWANSHQEVIEVEE